MNTCKFCGLRIKWCGRTPCDASGRDHRETCVGMLSATRDRIRDANHENLVSSFLEQSTVKRQRSLPKGEAAGRRSRKTRGRRQTSLLSIEGAVSMGKDFDAHATGEFF